MSSLSARLALNYSAALLELCTDKTVDDDWVWENLNKFHKWFYDYIVEMEFRAGMDHDIIEMAGEAHLWFNMYLHLHIINRIQHKSPGFMLLSEFRKLQELFDEEKRWDVEPAKRTLNKISIRQHLEAIKESILNMANAEVIKPA